MKWEFIKMKVGFDGETDQMLSGQQNKTIRNSWIEVTMDSWLPKMFQIESKWLLLFEIWSVETSYVCLRWVWSQLVLHQTSPVSFDCCCMPLNWNTWEGAHHADSGGTPLGSDILDWLLGFKRWMIPNSIILQLCVRSFLTMQSIERQSISHQQWVGNVYTLLFKCRWKWKQMTELMSSSCQMSPVGLKCCCSSLLSYFYMFHNI